MTRDLVITIPDTPEAHPHAWKCPTCFTWNHPREHGCRNTFLWHCWNCGRHQQRREQRPGAVYSTTPGKIWVLLDAEQAERLADAPDDDHAEVCCSKCGGLNVEYAVWYNPNTGERGEVFGSWNAGDNTFCSDCDDNTDLLDIGAEPEEFARLRRERIERERAETEESTSC